MIPGPIQRMAMLSVHTCPLATLGGKETGGMNVYVRELAREFGRRGLHVDVFTRSQDPRMPFISRRLGDTVRVVHIPAGREAPANKNAIYDHLPEFVRNVRLFAEGQGIRYDVLHSHYWLSGLVARDLKAAWGTPIVHMFHTTARLKNAVAQTRAELEPQLRADCEGEIMHFADRLIAATTLERDQLSALYGADPGKFAIVPPGVDLELFRPIPCEEARARIGMPEGGQLVLFVGRIQPIKGIDLLIRAMALLMQRNPQWREDTSVAIIGGHGDPSTDGELARLTKLRTSLGVGDMVTFLGSRDQDTLVDYYNAASVVVAPSHYESFGMVALEAMACATPVIATDVGGLSFNISDGFNGYLVASGDVEALAYKISLMLSQDELRRQLGLQARQWAERFDWRNIADETLAVYAGAMGLRAGTAPGREGADDVASVELERRECP